MTLEPITSISAEEAVAKESSLAPLADRLASVKFEPVSASGDSHVFTTEVAAHCEKRLGVKFHMGTKERRLRTSTCSYESSCSKNAPASEQPTLSNWTLNSFQSQSHQTS